MADFNARYHTQVMKGVHRDANTDLYRAKYHMPLDGETHERFIATKVPLRKNKDFRPRFKNYSFGFPTYKKDNYMRHWYNFLDVMQAKDNPVLVYAKVFAKSFIFGLFINSFGGLTYIKNLEKVNALDRHKQNTSLNYPKEAKILSSMRESYYFAKKPAITFAIGFTAFSYLTNKFEDWGYSTAQAMLRSTAILSPMYVFYYYDRPFTNFWYRTLGLFVASYFFLFAMKIGKASSLGGPTSPNSEKYYLKSVSPQEIAKIEYEDAIENYARTFQLRNIFNMGTSQSFMRVPEKHVLVPIS